MRFQSPLLSIALPLILAASAGGASLVGPFVPGSGNYLVVTGGDFETGDMAGWTDIEPDRGVFRPSSEQAISGAFSARSTVITAGTGPGFGPGRVMSVEPGRTYVLSAFLLARHMQGNLYVDLDDVSFEPVGNAVGATAGIPQWQFAYAKFTVPIGISQIHVRIGHDLIYPLGEFGYVDDVAVTPETEFKAPVPELSLTIEVSAVRLCWQTVAGVHYQLQSKPTSTAGAWTNLGEPVLGDGAVYCATDSVSGVHKIYRVIELP